MKLYDNKLTLDTKALSKRNTTLVKSLKKPIVSKTIWIRNLKILEKRGKNLKRVNTVSKPTNTSKILM